MSPYIKTSISGTILLVLLAAAHASPALDRASNEIAARRLSQTNTLDSLEILRDMESIAKTNLTLAVQENDFERINEIYARMMLIANTPPSNLLHWEEVQPRYVRLEYQILQALFEMREKWTRPNPLRDADVLYGTDYGNQNTPAEKILDSELRKSYTAWLKYEEMNRAKILQDGTLENRYWQKKQILSGWLRDEKYIPVIQEAVTNKALLKQLFPPTGIPRVMPVQLKKKD